MLKEQIAQHSPVIQRRSLPPDQHYRVPQQQSSYYDTAEDNALSPPRQPSSAIRYTDSQGNQVIQQGKKRIVIHDEPLPHTRRSHWKLYLGIGMVLMFGLYTGLSSLSHWFTNYQLDSTYGMPRTYQTDAVIYPGDSAEHPSHYIFLNLNGVVEIIELPHGDSSHARMYKGPQLFSDNAALIPITGEFKSVNGKTELLVHIQNQVVVYFNDGTQFRQQQ